MNNSFRCQHIYVLLSRVAAVILALGVASCSTHQVKNDGIEILNAALWTQTAAEYTANAMQAYRLASENLDKALIDPLWTAALEQGDGYAELPPAIVLDLDQTVLDTSRYNARLVMQYGSHKRDNFARWCRESAAAAIPGVKNFIDHAVERGVVIIYLSARHESLRDCTTRNLRTLGLPLPDKERLLLGDGTDSTSKTRHRDRVASQFRILLLLGDDLNDFVAGSIADPDTRRMLVHKHASRWGKEWIILPNPMYGKWEAALYDYDRDLLPEQRLEQKLQQLQP